MTDRPSWLRRAAQFVGRDEQLAVLRGAMTDARAGTRAVILVEGGAGMGKTALIREAITDADVEVIWVVGDDDELVVDYGLLGQIMRTVPVETRRFEADPAYTDPAQGGAALVDALDRTCVAAARPTVVVVDDAHWADIVSLRAVAFAARRLRRDPVVFILAVRNEEVANLPAGIGRLVDTEGIRVAVDALGSNDVRVLTERTLGRTVTSAAADRLCEHSGGSPLHLVTLLDEVPADDLLGVDELPAPRSFSTLLLSRLARCDVEVEAMVCAVAVLGEAATLRSAAAVAGVADPLHVLDAAIGAGLLSADTARQGRAMRVSVSHPLVRAAVLGDLALARRSRLHNSAAAVVEGPTRVYHLLRGSVEPDDDLWRDAVDTARSEADRGSHATAATLLLEASRIATSVTDGERSLLDGVDELLLAGQTRAAARLAGDVSAATPSPRRSFVAARLALMLGPRREARAHLEAAWDDILEWTADPERFSDLGDADRVLAARIAATAAFDAIDRGRGAEAVGWCRRALAIDPAQASATSCAHILATGHGIEGSPDAGLVELDGICAAADERGEPEVADAYCGRGVARLWSHDLDDARSDLERSLAAAEAAGSFQVQVTARNYLAEALYRQGCWDEALVVAQMSASIIEDTDQRWMAIMPLWCMARILAARGDARAAEYRDRAETESRASGSGIAVGIGLLNALEIGACRRDEVAVLEAGERLAAFGVADHLGPWRASYVEALIATGRLEDAEATATVLDGSAPTPLQVTESARAVIAIANARGDDELADRRAQYGLAVDPGPVGPYFRARLELTCGRMWRHRGERRRAADVLEGARARFAALGAAPYAEQVDREINALGLRHIRRSAVGTQELTPQEQAVARLVAQGLRNREVAAELVVSAKTVETHLSRVYAKLGIRSRTELAHRWRSGPPGS